MKEAKVIVTIAGLETELTVAQAKELFEQLQPLFPAPNWVSIPFLQTPPYLQPPYVVTVDSTKNTSQTIAWYDNQGNLLIHAQAA